MTDLRQRRHEATRQTLLDVAFALFKEHGFDGVTMEQVASAAGVSRSTAYRRFPTKEDVVLEVPRRWLDAFDQAFAELPDTTTLPDAVRVASLAVAQHIDNNRDSVLSAYSVLAQVPALQQSGVAMGAWLGRFMKLIDRFADVDPGTASTIAGAYMGGIDAMMSHWASTGGSGSVAESTSTLLDRFEPILP